MNKKAFGWCIVAASASLMTLSQRAEAYSYWTDEPQDYAEGNCGYPKGDSRDERTHPLRNGLDSMGWSGTYWSHEDAWPQDFIDSAYQAGGIDDQAADGVDLAIFSGHGNSGLLGFSHQHDTGSGAICHAGGTSDPNGIVLGRGNGGVAGNLVAISCCFLNPHTISDVFENGTVQIMGYGSPSSTNTAMVQAFWDALDTQNNIDAWLGAMEVSPGGGYQSPAVFTNGWDQGDVDWNRWNCGIRWQNCATSGWGYGRDSVWTLDIRDHGCAGCTGC